MKIRLEVEEATTASGQPGYRAVVVAPECKYKGLVSVGATEDLAIQNMNARIKEHADIQS